MSKGELKETIAIIGIVVGVIALLALVLHQFGFI